MMTRIEAIETTLKQFAGKPFEYGVTDCGAFIGSYLTLIEQMPQGLDELLQAAREDKATSRAALKKYGAATMSGLVSKHFKSLAPLQAATGDLAAVPSGSLRDPACGMVLGQRVAVLGETGAEYHNLGAAVKAWKV